MDLQQKTVAWVEQAHASIAPQTAMYVGHRLHLVFCFGDQIQLQKVRCPGVALSGDPQLMSIWNEKVRTNLKEQLQSQGTFTHNHSELFYLWTRFPQLQAAVYPLNKHKVKNETPFILPLQSVF